MSYYYSTLDYEKSYNRVDGTVDQVTLIAAFVCLLLFILATVAVFFLYRRYDDRVQTVKKLKGELGNDGENKGSRDSLGIDNQVVPVDMAAQGMESTTWDGKYMGQGGKQRHDSNHSRSSQYINSGSHAGHNNYNTSFEPIQEAGRYKSMGNLPASSAHRQNSKYKANRGYSHANHYGQPHLSSASRQQSFMPDANHYGQPLQSSASRQQSFMSDGVSSYSKTDVYSQYARRNMRRGDSQSRHHYNAHPSSKKAGKFYATESANVSVEDEN